MSKRNGEYIEKKDFKKRRLDSHYGEKTVLMLEKGDTLGWIYTKVNWHKKLQDDEFEYTMTDRKGAFFLVMTKLPCFSP